MRTARPKLYRTAEANRFLMIVLGLTLLALAIAIAWDLSTGSTGGRQLG